MSRAVFTVLAAVTSLLFIATVVMWFRSYAVDDSGMGCADDVTWLDRGSRKTVRSERGRVTLYAPPSDQVVQSNESGLTPQQIAAAVANSDIEWEAFDDGNPRGTRAYARPWGTGAAEPLNPWHSRTDKIHQQFTLAELAGPLLRTLEDPDRFIAAHFGLTMCWAGKTADRSEMLADGQLLAEWDGLRVQLRPEKWHGTSGDFDVAKCVATVDGNQLPAIRQQWHRRLDVATVSVPYWMLSTATAVLPALFVAWRLRSFIRRRRLRRSGYCPDCGYDLRATPSRCPECGAESGM